MNDDIQEQWAHFKDVFWEAATTSFGPRGSRKEERIRSGTWKLTEERKALKKRNVQAT